MIILIIEIDGYNHQVLLKGKLCSKQQLRQRYWITKSLAFDIRELPEVFCKHYHFEQIPYNVNTKVHFVLDTDTDRIYTPTY